MPKFLGIFTRKHKHAAGSPSAIGSDDHDSMVSVSPTVSGSIGWDNSYPSSPSKSVPHLGTAPSVAHGERSAVYPSSPSASSTASSSKLRLPFSRKRQPRCPAPAAAMSTTSVNNAGTHPVTHREFHTAPPFLAERDRNSFASDEELTDARRLRPPPSKSAIFAAYADPQSALSTRSLPNDVSQPFMLQESEWPSIHSLTSAPLFEPPAPVQNSASSSSTKKSFFSWTKTPSSIQVSKSKSTSMPPLQAVQDSKTTKTEVSSDDLANSSFNLKSFRHVGPSFSADTQLPSPAPAVPSPVPLSRPRGPSVGDSSQRISVAAFREAQARRSMASSPVPSLQSSSQEPGGAGARASLILASGRSSFSHEIRPDGQHLPQARNKSLVFDSDAETSSTEEDSDDGGDQERTVTQRGIWSGKMKARAKSELGHGSSRHDTSDMRSEARPQSLAQPAPRQRASVSTSAATPSAAARRASILVNANDPVVEHKRNSRHIRDSAVYSNPGTIVTTPEVSAKQPARPTSPASNSSSEDDAPLATLTRPRRPGSALSSVSGSSHPSAQNRNRSNSNLPLGRCKPLVDISEVIGGKTPLPVREGRKGELSEDKGFTMGNTLLSASVSLDTSPSRNAKVPPPISTSFLTPTPGPISPTESATSTGFVTAASSVRAGSGWSSPPPPNNEPAKRDGLSERLARVAKGVSSAVGPTSPLPTPLVPPNLNDPTDNPKRMSFPKISSQSSFETARAASPSPIASRRSADLTKIPAPVITLVREATPGPPDEELVKILGASVKLISRTGEGSQEAADTESEESDEDSSDDDSKNEEQKSPHDDEKIADEWEKVDPREVQGQEDYKTGDGVLKSLSRGKAKGKGKEVNVEYAPKATEPPIAPIPIKQRMPTPSFSVTSRPPLAGNGVATSNSGSGSTSAIPSSTSSGSLASSISSGTRTRPRSSTLLNPTTLDLPTMRSASPITPFASGTGDTNRARVAAILSSPALRSPAASRASGNSGHDSKRSSMIDGLAGPPGVRQRSSTMLPTISLSPVPTMPTPPFARRNSPASSTGDSSNGRTPLTPRDGSDIGSTGGSSSAMKNSAGMKNTKRRSVSFEEDLKNNDAATTPSPPKGKMAHKGGKEQTNEEKRKERRRSEAKAAIELGNVINGPAPVVDDEDTPVNQSMHARMSTMNPMMGMGGGVHPMQMPSWNGPWGNTMGQQPMMNGPSFMFPPGDPSLIMAHQQAMIIAKQAYQLAVAQQAAVAAGDEWERGSVTSGFSGFGGGMPGARMMAPPQYGMGMNMNMNMMSMTNSWSSGASGVFPSTARSMYGGISGARSEYGGGGGNGGWSSSRSTYGESFGPPTGRVTKSGVAERDWRDSGYYPPVPPVPSQAQGNFGGRTPAPRTRTTSQPMSTRSAVRKAPPPSSWKGS